MKKIFFRIIVSTLLCSVLNAIILGVSSKAFQVNIVSEDQFEVYWKAIFVAFTIIFFSGWWVFYIPFFALFPSVVNNTKFNSYIFYVLTGAVLGSVYSAVIILLFLIDQTYVAWYSFPTTKEWITVPEYAVIGAVYGVIYRKWFDKK